MSNGMECLHCRDDCRFCNCPGQQESDRRSKAETEEMCALFDEVGLDYTRGETYNSLHARREKSIYPFDIHVSAKDVFRLLKSMREKNARRRRG